MSSKTNVDRCADGDEGPALKLTDAPRDLAEVQPVGGSETLARAAPWAVPSADVVGDQRADRIRTRRLTAMRCSARAFAAGETRLEVVGTSQQGGVAGTVGDAQCARIMTGAPMPRNRYRRDAGERHRRA